MPDEQIYLAAIAGLLHDIGKFALRSGMGGEQQDDVATKGESLRLAQLSGDFVATFVPDSWRAAVQQSVAHHHQPRDHASRVVGMANRLAGGEHEDQTSGDANAGEDGGRSTQLRSIFCGVVADGKRAAARRYLPVAALTVSDRNALFPGDPLPDNLASQRHAALWEQFSAEMGQVTKAHTADGDLQTFVESLLFLLQRYTWCVSAADSQRESDVSLFDHSRMVAALAAVLASRSEGELTSIETAMESGASAAPEQPEVALLVGGDISGVQDFIYTITSRGAAGALRGRSFYLQLLTEAIVRYVLRQLDLPATNVIYAGGGTFYLLVRPADGERLADVARNISTVLLQHHRGDLYVAVRAVPLRPRDFLGGRISGAWRTLSEELRQAKLRRFGELEAEALQAIFQPQGHGGNEEAQCQVCGVEHDIAQIILDGEDEPVRKCPACKSYEKLGDALRDAHYLYLEERAPAQTKMQAYPGTYGDVFAAFGLRVTLLKKITDVRPQPEERAVLLALSDGAYEHLQTAPRSAVGRRLIVNVIPSLTEAEYQALKDKLDDLPEYTKNGQWPGYIKPFSVLEEQSAGIKRLGVLRMDVDNLGKLFSEGLGASATLSRVASLSFAISLFFEGWVAQLAGQVAGDRLYSVYSGGDDLFFVGSWDAVVEFARVVRAELTDYAAGHPGIHTSAGIALVGGKYPLYQAARDAGDAEESAKGYRQPDGHAKDAICFLGEVQPWERFGLEAECSGGFGSVHQLYHLLADMSGEGDEGGNAPKSVIRQLLQQYEHYSRVLRDRQKEGRDVNRQGQPQTVWGPWMWRTYYLLKRKAGKDTRGEIGRLADRLEPSEFLNIEWIGLAARWAEIKTRVNRSSM
ncbi:MAG: type III-A CRISPR-associated protein Cas10/Csm1 [Caldilineaceae bacterium]|nr:type III-A CRISPR-associated protein Cas10/Csm1 [Caldilineaceae bacterium]